MLSDCCPVCLSCPVCDVGVLCPNGIEWIKMKLNVEVGLGPGHIVLDEDPAPPKKGHNPQFSAHVYCGQTSGWIKMPLGKEVGLCPGDIVLDRDPAPPTKKTGTASRHFGPMSVVAKRSAISATAELLLKSINI